MTKSNHEEYRRLIIKEMANEARKKFAGSKLMGIEINFNDLNEVLAAFLVVDEYRSLGLPLFDKEREE